MKELLILDVPKPNDEGSVQKPTKDIATGQAAKVLDEKLVASSNSPEDINRALEQLVHSEK